MYSGTQMMFLMSKHFVSSMVVCKPDAVTITKTTQIHGASNAMLVYALQKPETSTKHTIPNRCFE